MWTVLLILFHDHRAALSEVPRCHKHHQYSKPLPADSEFRATEGHWYAAVLKRPAPLFFLVKVILTREPMTEPAWLTDSWWETDLWAGNNVPPSSRGYYKSLYIQKMPQVEAGGAKGLHLGSVHPLICICSEVTEGRAALERDAAERTALPRVFT